MNAARVARGMRRLWCIEGIKSSMLAGSLEKVVFLLACKQQHTGKNYICGLVRK
jgi:hypothetical protein